MTLNMWIKVEYGFFTDQSPRKKNPRYVTLYVRDDNVYLYWPLRIGSLLHLNADLELKLAEVTSADWFRHEWAWSLAHLVGRRSWTETAWRALTELPRDGEKDTDEWNGEKPQIAMYSVDSVGHYHNK